MTRSPGVVLSWIDYHGRSADLATSLGFECKFNPVGLSRLPAPMRYIVLTMLTAWGLVRARPAVVVVMSPPPFPIFVAWLYVAVARRPLYIDAHSGVFTHPLWRRFLPAVRCIANRYGAILVTNAEAAEWAVRAGFTHVLELHDVIEARPNTAVDGPAYVLVVASWRDDEPMAEVAAAAAALPDVEFRVSGDPRGPGAAELRALANVRLLGYIARAEFDVQLAGAEVVVALTTRESTMQRGGYEAMCWGRALLTSDTAVLREFFDDAASYTKPDSASITRSLSAALTSAAKLRDAIEDRRRVLAAQQLRQLGHLSVT